jgi:RNA-directed DNA polymerase
MSSPEGSEQDDEELEPGSESISDPIFGTGSLSALVVLMTLGNAVRADPVEERGASLYRIVHGKHGGILKPESVSTKQERIGAPWKGAVTQWVRIPPGNFRSSR